MHYRITRTRAVARPLLFTVAAACLPGQVLAQSGASTAIEEVIVTARKREESLQETPISIQAFSQQGLEQRGITTISELGNFTPNMVFDRAAAIGGSNSSAIVYIRGIGQDAAIPTIDLGVGPYVDGVYLARSVGGVFDIIDVERVEDLDNLVFELGHEQVEERARMSWQRLGALGMTIGAARMTDTGILIEGGHYIRGGMGRYVETFMGLEALGRAPTSVDAKLDKARADRDAAQERFNRMRMKEVERALKKQAN